MCVGTRIPYYVQAKKVDRKDPEEEDTVPGTGTRTVPTVLVAR
jgi:hypothetical protein